MSVIPRRTRRSWRVTSSRSSTELEPSSRPSPRPKTSLQDPSGGTRMRRKDRRQRAHAQREPRSSRALPMLLGLLVVAFGGLAGVAFLMPELLAGLVPPPFDGPTVGMVAGGLAALLTVALMASVVRGRRRSAEREFSRPQLTTVAALSPEEQAVARQDDESSPLLPEPPSMPPPAEVGAPAAMSAAMGVEPAPAGVSASSQPAA